ncbi:MAG TPA: adenylate/guanylate cyclase domain-containing protein [Acidimicrobiia bacterium]|nr:adenylate/guanylate cyclase domain-containing protein [Acidimicrobiia bacterium]
MTFLPDGATVTARPTETLLDAALVAGIPHTAACGGVGECSTCRVLVVEGAANLSERSEAEHALGDPMGFDASIRLACQTYASGPASVRRLVLDPDDEVMSDVRRRSMTATRVGELADVTVLFADIRRFTAFSENLRPYDVIHVLNRFFGLARAAIADQGGRIATYMGDGFMAVFGVPATGQAPPQAPDPVAALDALVAHVEAPERAVRAGLALIEAVDGFQTYVERLHGRRFGISVGIHHGPAVVGALGSGASQVVTAIGDTVNTAARVEWANRRFGTRMLVSDAVVETVGSRLAAVPQEPIELPGKQGVHTLYAVEGIAP